MIVLENLTKRFGDLTAVDAVSMAVRRGEVLGFLGPNGAGKSTTMKMVCGYLTPTSGTARVQGHDVVTEPMAVKAAIGYLPEGAPTYGDMRVSAFLRFIAQIRGFNGAEIGRRVDRVREMAALDEVFDRPVETLSKGFKRRVGLAQAILHDPEVLIMDEPTDGLDPNQKHQVRTLIKDMAHNKAIVISTHILEEVEAICTRAVVIAHGKLLADGTPEQLLRRDARHNAVVIKLAAGQAADIVAGLAALDQVAGVDALGDPVGGTAAFRARPKAGASIVLPVGDLLRSRNVTPEEMYVERGHMDEVFRKITQGDAQGGADA
ncbi:MAG TPA: ABC transporter ATP-binding protein [Rhodospirillaceae bacterium]|nr:ABC transporter ATP-binding protein [Magnetovibrio sp.]HCS68997.1 ABC transporter ATP-binding protein [Rhodospirillaceae bacterium]